MSFGELVIDERVLNEDRLFYRHVMRKVADWVISEAIDGKLRDCESVLHFLEEESENAGEIARSAGFKNWTFGHAYHFIRGSGRQDILEKLYDHIEQTEWRRLDDHLSEIESAADLVIMRQIHFALFGEKFLDPDAFVNFMQSEHVLSGSHEERQRKFEEVVPHYSIPEAARGVCEFY